MAEEIKIIVGADTSKLQSELKKAEAELKDFQTQLNNTGDSKKIDELNKKIAETKTIISNLKTQIPPIEITADNKQLISQIKKSEDELKILQGYASEVKILADGSQLDAVVMKAEAELKAIGSTISLIDIKGDSTQIDNTIKKVEAELIGLKSAQVQITADSSQIDATINKIDKELLILRDLQSNIVISADSRQLDAVLLKAEAELKAIGSTISLIDIKADSTQIDSTIKKVEAELIGLKSAQVQITADPSQIDATINRIDKELLILRDLQSNIVISADSSQLDAALLKAEAELKAIGSTVSLINIKGDTSQIDAAIVKVEAELTGLKSVQVPVTADTTPLTTEVIQAENSLPSAEVVVEANLNSISDIKKFIETNLRDVQQLQANININANTEVFVKELKSAEDELKRVQSELSKVNTGSEFNKLSQSAKTLQSNISNLKGQITATSGAINKMPQQLNSASYSITNLSRIVSDGAYGFIGIANNIGPFVDSLAAAKKEAQATGTSLGKNLIASLSGPGGLSLAFAAVTTAITFAQIGFSAWTRGSQKAKESTDEFTKSLRDAEQGAIAQGVKLEGLVNIITNSTESEKNRNIALKEANDLLKPYGEKIDSINISVEKAKELTDKYTEALINQAVGAKLADKIADLRLKKLDLENKKTLQQSVINGSIASQSAKAAKLTAKQYGTSDAAALQYLSTTTNISNEQEKLTGINEDLVDTQKELDKYTKQYTDSTTKANAAISGFGTQTTHTGKDIETLPKALAKFEKSLKDIQDVGISIGTPQIEINKDKIKEFEDILKKIVEKFNVKTDSKVYIDLVARLQDINFQIVQKSLSEQLSRDMRSELNVPIPVDGVTIEIVKPKFDQTALDKAEREFAQSNFIKAAKKKKYKIPFGELSLSTEGLKLNTAKLLANQLVPDGFRKNVKDGLKKSESQLELEWKDYADKIDNFATNALVEAAANIGIAFGEALGAALTGGSFAKVFGNVFELLAGGVEALGKQLIQIGTLAVIAQQALAQLLANPFAAIAVGIALTALGAALKNLTQKSAFATGTRYAPGGMALVGERGPEMINLPRGSQVVPAAQTAHMMGGIGGQVEVFGVLRGQDIYFSNKKYSQTYNRTT